MAKFLEYQGKEWLAKGGMPSQKGEWHLLLKKRRKPPAGSAAP